VRRICGMGEDIGSFPKTSIPSNSWQNPPTHPPTYPPWVGGVGLGFRN